MICTRTTRPQREKMPDDLQPQIDRIRQLVQAFNIPVLEAEGYEADDVLGTAARLASGQDVDVIILTGDRDLLQLATESIHILLSGQKLSEAAEFGPLQVAEKYGVTPEQLVDLKALIGDASDNIPGVRGIGEKTATALLQQFGSLDEIYTQIEQVPPRFRTKLDEGREAAYLSRTLGKIVRDVPMVFELEACRLKPYDRELVADLFRQLEFRSLLSRLEPAELPPRARWRSSLRATPPQNRRPSTWVVQTPEDLARLADQLATAPVIAFDTETTSTDAVTAALVGISLAIEPDRGIYIPVGHRLEPGLLGDHWFAPAGRRGGHRGLGRRHQSFRPRH